MNLAGQIKRFSKGRTPGVYEMLRERKHANARRRKYLASNLPFRPCHLRELFVAHDGYVYPCCFVWGQKHMRIGHIRDADLLEKIGSFFQYCSCERYRLRKGHPGEAEEYGLLNFELSLACQGKCAMCCVGAPEASKKPTAYDFYDDLSRLVERCRPLEIMVQGGEVLIQKRSLEWIADLKRRWGDISLGIVTNGNVDIAMADKVAELFDRVVVSVVGFSPDTYRKITGMDIARTVAFVGALLKTSRPEVTLKYLVTPLSLHETNLFLEWAIGLAPHRIRISDSLVAQYIEMRTFDDFWQKIMDRTGEEVRKVLLGMRDRLIAQRTVVGFDTALRKMFGIDDEFVRGNGLDGIVVWDKC